MKKITTLLVFLISTTLFAQTYVPDDNFEQALIDLGYDSGALDDYVPTANINSITSLNIDNKNIANLTGIEDFVSLQTLVCSNNQLTLIDISQLTALDYFDCNFNQLSSLDVSTNTSLTVLACRANLLTSIDVSTNLLLQYFSCRDNQLTNLDVTNNSNLVRLWCFNNQLTSLNVKNGTNTNISNSDFDATNNPNLTCIEVDDVAWSGTNWTNIDTAASFSDVSCQQTYVPDDNFEQALIDLGYDSGALDDYVPTANISGVTNLYINSKGISDLTGIEDFTSLESLYAQINNLSSINVTQNSALTLLNVSYNSLTSLDISNNSNLNELRCLGNSLQMLNTNSNPLLTTLYCGFNNISTLDLTNNTALNYLDSQTNSLTNIDLSQNNNLTGIHIGNNNISTINLSQNTNITSLNLANNNISNIDFSNNLLIQTIILNNNQISSLDVSTNSNLTFLNVSDNSPLNHLDLRNGNNTNFSNFYATGNPNLTCILVDDATWSAANWSNIDTTSTFVNDQAACDSLYVDQFDLENAFSIYPNPVIDSFTIHNNLGYAIDTISIYTVLGKLIYQSKKIQKTIDVSSLSNGMYLIKLNTNNQVITKKIIINQ